MKKVLLQSLRYEFEALNKIGVRLFFRVLVVDNQLKRKSKSLNKVVIMDKIICSLDSKFEHIFVTNRRKLNI